MSSPPRVLIIMPAYNEAAVIASVIEEVTTTLPQYDCIVVNDGSPDDTAETVLRTGVQLLDLPVNLGVGGAMRAGFKYAVLNDYDIAVQLDSDGQHDPRYVPALVEALQECDIAIGARFADEGDYRVSGPRAWAMKLLSFYFSKLLRTRLTDTTSGFKAYGRDALRLFSVDYPAEYLGDTIEALVNAHKTDLTVRQIPVAMRERAGGVPSHNPLRSAVYLGRASIALLVANLRPSPNFRKASDS